MSSGNRFRKHVVLFPEDELTSLVAQGFVEDPHVNERTCWVHHNFGKGWSSVVDGVDDFDLGRFPDSHLVLIIDYDRCGQNRLNEIRSRLASNPYHDRIYVLGAAHEADDLKRQVAELSHRHSITPKAVGSALAMSSAGSETCTDGLWGISQLAHNAEELMRLCHAVRDVIFKS